MRPIQALLALVVLALLGIGGWFLLRTSDPSEPAASAAPGRSAGSSPEAARSGEVDLRAPSAAGGPDRAAQRVASSPAPSELSPSSDPAAGGGPVLTGLILDDQGKPLPGARVFSASAGTLPLFAGLPLDARGSDALPWIRRVEALTGADGRFELSGLKPGGLRLAVRARGFAPHDDDGRALPAEERFDVGSIRLERGALISGRVVDQRGAPVEGAEIVRLSATHRAAVDFGEPAWRSGAVVATTTPDGGFLVDEIGVGPWALQVETPGHPYATVDGTTSWPGERVEGLLVALETGEEIQGSVQGLPPGEELVVRAVAQEITPDQASEVVGDAPAGAELRSAAVGFDGGFRLLGLRSGRVYNLLLSRGGRRGREFALGWAPGLAAAVLARAGERGVVLVYQPEAALTFQVVDASSGAPVEEYRVEAGIDWRVPDLDQRGRPVTSRPEGRARVGNLRPRSPSDKASLRISAVGYAPYELEGLALSAGRDTEIGQIALAPLPLLTVRVLDDRSGQPIEDARVSLSEVEPERGDRFGRRIEIEASAGDGPGEDLQIGGSDRQTARTDALGVARLTSMTGRPSRLSVRHAAHAPWRSEVFTVAIGPEERVVRLGLGGAVTVRLLDPAGEPVAGGRVEHQAAGEEGGFIELGLAGSQGVTNARGEARFEHLEPGLHRFRRAGGDVGGFMTSGGDALAMRMRGMEGEERGWVEAQVSEGGASEVELIAPLELAVEGTVREAGEPLAGATVELASREEAGQGMPRLPGFGGGPRAQTDGQGRYRIAGVEPGEYTLSVRHESRAMPAELEIRVREVDLRQDLELSVAIVEGRVTDEQGKPLAGVRVRPERARSQGGPRAVAVRMIAFATSDGGGTTMSVSDGSTSEVEAHTDAEGRYTLRGVAPGVDLQVLAVGEGLQPTRSKAFQVGEDEVRRGVDVALSVAGSIQVRAVRADGSPGRNLQVSARFTGAEAGEVEPKTSFIPESGEAVLDGLKPGAWRVELRAFGPAGEAAPIVPQEFEVRAGERTQASFGVP